MKLRSCVLVAVLSVPPLMAACGSAENETSDADIVTFPAAVFTNAQTITYGQTIQNLPFQASQKYLAVKFQGTKGDRILGTVMPRGSTKSIVHLARKEGTTFVSLKAGGVDSASQNIVLHTLPDSGTYYLVFRTNPTADGLFDSVNLERIGIAGGRCADAGKIPTLQALANATSQGSTPSRGNGIFAKITRRTCTTATGCGAVTKEFSYMLVSNTYIAMPQGAGFKVDVKSEVSREQPRVVLSATGDVSGTIEFDDLTPLAQAEGRSNNRVVLPVKGSLGPTCSSLDEAYIRFTEGFGYIEYRIQPVAPNVSPWGNAPRTPTAALKKVTPIDVLSDEEVLSLFPVNGQTLTLNQRLSKNTAQEAGEYRDCHPLTGCSENKPIYGSSRLSPCARFIDAYIRPYWLDVTSAKVSGASQYSIVTEKGTFVVSDGVAIFPPSFSVRMGANALQVYEAPQKYEDPTYKWTQESGGATCTFPFTWPPPP